MGKAIFQISLIICVNLLAFLSVGLILDALFKTQGIFLLISLALSLPFLGLIMYIKAKNITQKLHNFSSRNDEQRNNISTK